jgi:hypothetical protein
VDPCNLQILPRDLCNLPLSLLGDAKSLFDRYDSDHNRRIAPWRAPHPMGFVSLPQPCCHVLHCCAPQHGALGRQRAPGFKDVVKTLHAVELRTLKYTIWLGTWSTS